MLWRKNVSPNRRNCWSCPDWRPSIRRSINVSPNRRNCWSCPDWRPSIRRSINVSPNRRNYRNGITWQGRPSIRRSINVSPNRRNCWSCPDRQGQPISWYKFIIYIRFVQIIRSPTTFHTGPKKNTYIYTREWLLFTV